MSRRTTATSSLKSLLTPKEEGEVISTVIEENKSSESKVEKLEIKLAELEAKYEKLVGALRMNGAVSTALNKFYD